jgi:hypothetical protein
MKVRVEDIAVYLEAAVKEKINHWVKMAQGEVSGLGLVEEINDLGLIRGYRVTDVFLAEQSCNGSGTVISPESGAKLMIELEMMGIDTGKLKLWWHSHADLGVFWSGTDDETISGFRPQDYFISLVVNKDGKSLCRLDIFKPIRLSIEDVRTDVIIPGLGLEEECKKEFAEKVKENSFTWTPRSSPNRFTKEQLKNFSEEEITNMLCTGEIEWWEIEELENERWLSQEGGYFNDF